MPKIITIKSHQFENKNKIELSVVSGDYYCIGEVQCFSVYFLEYNTGSYFEDSNQDHHYQVCGTVYFPLTDFLSAIKYFHFYIEYIQQSKETKEFSGILMDLKEIKSIHDSLLEKKDDQTLEIPNHLPPNMKLVFGERQEVQEKFSQSRYLMDVDRC